MYYLGIDIGKNTHVAPLLNEEGQVIIKGFSFSNSIDGAQALIDKCGDVSKADIEIGMEATGHYWLSLYDYLAELGFVIHVINPIQTDGCRKGTQIRRTKTDTIIYLVNLPPKFFWNYNL